MIKHTPTEVSNTVLSEDGTRIGYLSVGKGPSVIVVPGALSVASGYAEFARVLAGHFTVHTIERRGRGLSGPQGDEYSIVKECEDVLALQREVGASLLVGHSFGGLVALEVARNNQSFSKIAVYEPGISIGGSIPMNWMPIYEQRLAEQKYLDAFVEFSLGLGPERARKTPHWLMKFMLPLVVHAHERELMLGLLPENLREHKEVARLDSSYENYRQVSAAVLFMYGGKSDLPWVTLAKERLKTVLPQCETRVFPGLDHFGIDKKAPGEVASVVSDFFQSRLTA